MQTVKNIDQNELKLLSDSDFWMSFHHDFQLHSAHIDELSEWTQTAMHVLHSQLLLNNEYQHALARAENETIINNNLVISLFNNNFIRVNLIALKQERNLPLHDHPGSSGSMMVISGNVRGIVCEYDDDPADNSNYSRSLLTVAANKVFSENNTSCFTQDRYNIHSIESLTNRAVLIVIHTPPFAPNQQTFFFTTSPQQEIGSQILVQRVRAQASEKFRKNNIKGIVK